MHPSHSYFEAKQILCPQHALCGANLLLCTYLCGVVAIVAAQTGAGDLDSETVGGSHNKLWGDEDPRTLVNVLALDLSQQGRHPRLASCRSMAIHFHGIENIWQ
jgi:hypothetical protein